MVNIDQIPEHENASLMSQLLQKSVNVTGVLMYDAATPELGKLTAGGWRMEA